MIIERFLYFCGTNYIIMGITSLCGIFSLILTVIVTIRTSKISKILHYNSITSQYNKERKAFQEAFEGHRKSILEDGLHSQVLLNNILKSVEEYRAKFHEILSTHEKITMILFIHLLKKQSDKVDYTKVCNYLAKLSGRLSKKEDKKYA